MAGKPSLQVITASLACAAVLEVFAQVSGFPLDFGVGADIAFIPALFALFVFGFESAFYIALLTFLAVFALGSSWYECVSRLVAILPFLCIAGYESLSAGGVRLSRNAMNGVLGFYFALLLFMVFSPFVPLEAGNPFAPPQFAPAIASQVVSLSVGEYLLGTIPVALLLVFSAFVFLRWVNNREEAGARIFSSIFTMGWLLLVALPVRAAATAAAYYYYSGPALTGLTPAQLLSSTHPLSILAWSAGFGLILALIAWAMFIVVENASGTMHTRASALLKPLTSRQKPFEQPAKPARRPLPKKKPARKKARR